MTITFPAHLAQEAEKEVICPRANAFLQLLHLPQGG